MRKLSKYTREEERTAWELKKAEERLREALQKKEVAERELKKAEAKAREAKDVFLLLINEEVEGGPNSNPSWDKFLRNKARYLAQIEATKERIAIEMREKGTCYSCLRAARHSNQPQEVVLWLSSIADHTDRIRDLNSEIYDMYQMITKERQEALGTPECLAIINQKKEAEKEEKEARKHLARYLKELQNAIRQRCSAKVAHYMARLALDKKRY